MLSISPFNPFKQGAASPALNGRLRPFEAFGSLGLRGVAAHVSHVVAGYFQLACPKTDSTENSGGNSLSVGFACFSL